MLSMCHARFAVRPTRNLRPASTKQRIWRLSLGFVGCVSIAGYAQSPAPPSAPVRPTTIDFPGSSSTRAQGINKAGDIVGTYEVWDPAVVVHSHGFLLTKGHFTTIDFPGSFGTEAYGINAAGQIVGVYWDNRGAELGRHGFLLSGARFVRIDAPHASVTRPLGINDRGEIVGVYTLKEPSGIPGSEAGGLLFRLLGYPHPYDYEYGHGFVYANGRFTDVDFPGAARGEQTMATAINSAGQVVGGYIERNYASRHGFMMTKGNYLKLDVASPRQTDPTGVNSAGQVVGHLNYTTGFLWDRGRMTAIDFTHIILGATDTIPCGFNDAGQVVGYYNDAGDHTTPIHKHGFILNPDR
jgi:probable HAF family extracellular repeat protein